MKIDFLGPGDDAVLENVAPDVFDEAIQPVWAHEYLNDPRHHIVVARDGDCVIGMATAVHYLHPDKPPQLFINEVGVASTHHRRGIGRRLMNALLEKGKALGCSEAWVTTETDNTAARGLYANVKGKEDAETFVLYEYPLPKSADKSAD